MIVLRIFVPFALGFFLSYLFRVVNAVIAPDLVRSVGLTAADLGLLTSAYFLTFAAFQLPLGILLDRFGPRRTEAALLAFAALGAFVFAAAETSFALIVGRALIGLGVSACLMAAFKAFVMWFPGPRLPLVNGCQMAVGGLGALTGTVPVQMALQATDWRGVFVFLGGLSLAIGLAIFFVVPERRGDHAPAPMRDQLRGVVTVFTSPVFWRIAPLTVTVQAAFLSIQSLWAGPWLRDVAGLGRDAVADHLLLIAAAMVAGFLFMGAIAERLGRLGVRPVAVAVSGMGAFIVLQGAIVFGWTDGVAAVWALFGFFGTTGILSYAVLSQSFAPELAGRAITGLNVLVFTGAFLSQWGIGAVIDLWPAGASGGYAPPAYRAAFGVVLAVQAAALLWLAVSGRGRPAER